MTPTMRAMIRQTCAVERVNPQSAWSKRNAPWNNLPKEWGRPTIVCSTSGSKAGWQGFLRESIGSLSGGRTDSNGIYMDPCTGRQRVQICWRHMRAGCHWIMSIMLNGIIGSGQRWIWRTVQGKSGRWGEREDKVTRERQRIGESASVIKREVTSQSCQIQLVKLWFAGCRMATISFYLQTNFKLCLPMSGTGRSWLISLTKRDTQNSHTF